MTEEQCEQLKLKYETLKYWHAVGAKFSDELARGWQKESIRHAYTKRTLKLSLAVNVALLLFVIALVTLLVIS